MLETMGEAEHHLIRGVSPGDELKFNEKICKRSFTLNPIMSLATRGVKPTHGGGHEPHG